MTKIKTPTGCMQLFDDKAIDVVKKSFENVASRKSIDVRNLIETKAKSYYKVLTPCGCAYVKNYGNTRELQAFHKRREVSPLEIITVC